MAKKLLCVMLSVLMVVSLLPMGVMAVTDDGIVEVGDTVNVDGTSYTVVAVDTDGTNSTYGGNNTGNGAWLENIGSSTLQGYLNTTGAMIYVQYTSTSDRYSTNVGLQFNVAGYPSVNYRGSYDYSQKIFVTSTELTYRAFSVSDLIAKATEAGYSMDNCYQVCTDLGSSNSTYIHAVSILVPEASTPTEPAEEETNSASGIIYVNEDYHALLLNGYFISIPHTDDNGDGYCDVCNEYIGSEDSELEVVTIDGVDYYVVFTYDTTIASGNWNKVTVGDSTLAAALNTEGAKLVVTRDTETVVSYADGEYDKFMLGKDDSSYVQLGTKGHTSADEDSVDVDCADDDGYVVTYDGAAVYAALSDAGLADLSSYVLISNTSASYNITSVEVLVPVGTVVGEDVDVSEPAEVGDTTTEDDGEEDADSVDVADNADDAAESNPTTGVVLALVPMAVAGFAVVASKRR